MIVVAAAAAAVLAVVVELVLSLATDIAHVLPTQIAAAAAAYTSTSTNTSVSTTVFYFWCQNVVRHTIAPIPASASTSTTAFTTA